MVLWYPDIGDMSGAGIALSAFLIPTPYDLLNFRLIHFSSFSQLKVLFIVFQWVIIIMNAKLECKTRTMIQAYFGALALISTVTRSRSLNTHWLHRYYFIFIKNTFFCLWAIKLNKVKILTTTINSPVMIKYDCN